VKLLKSGLYKASNLTFNPNTLEARSYEHWLFTKHVDGIGLVVNTYGFSTTTRKHQAKIRKLMVDLNVPRPALELVSKRSLDDLKGCIVDTITHYKKRIALLEQAMEKGRELKNKERRYKIDVLNVNISVLQSVKERFFV
jgi:hypothetical protein